MESGRLLQNQARPQTPFGKYIPYIFHVFVNRLLHFFLNIGDDDDDYMQDSLSESDDEYNNNFAPDDLPLNADFQNPQDLFEIIEDARKTMQDPEKKKRNGVTMAMLGSSGCGKSTLIRKILIDKIYCSKNYITSIFTQSSTSDAFKDLPKDVTMFKCGLDQQAILYCYHTNSKYDKKYNFVNILDDVLEIRYVKLVRDMFLIFRNTNITSVVSVQYPKLVPVSVRSSVYFTFAFDFNNEEAIEIIVRGWLRGYLEGNNISEKMDSYREWVRGGKDEDSAGHRLFLLDNLHHKCYCVTEDYVCYELSHVKKKDASSSKTLSSDWSKTPNSKLQVPHHKKQKK